MEAPKILLEAKSLARYYGVRRNWFHAPRLLRALDGVCFTLEGGRTLGIVGESGCGKSTLARLVALIDTPTSGALLLDGVPVSPDNRATYGWARPQIQMVFQDPLSSLNPRKKIAAMLEEPLALNTAMSKSARRQRAEEMLLRVGLRSEMSDRYPHMFSGGQRQRIAIARALMLSPKLVVADEAVSALDVSVQGQILNLFMDLQAEIGVAYLFISHNLAVVEHIADTVMVMYLGKAVEFGRKAQVFSAPAHPYTRALLASTPRLTRARRGEVSLRGEAPSAASIRERGCAYQNRCPHANARCLAEEPLLKPVDGQQQAACHAVEEGRLEAAVTVTWAKD